MGYRNPATSAGTLDTGAGFATGSVESYTDNPTSDLLGSPLYTAAGFLFRDGISGDNPASLVNAAYYTPQGNNSLTEQGGSYTLKGGSYNGVQAPELDLSVETLQAGGYGPVARLIAGTNGLIYLDGSLILQHDPPWTTFAPNWRSNGSSPAIGNGSLIAKYRQLGRLVAVSYYLSFGSTTSGGNGPWLFDLPVPAAAGREQYLSTKAFCAAGTFVGVAYFPGGSTVIPYLPASTSSTQLQGVQNANTSNAAGTGVPVVAGSYTFGTGHNFAMFGVYEAATST